MHGAPHTFCLMLWSFLWLPLSNHNDNKSSVTPRNTTWSSSIANPLERSIGGWRQRTLLPLTPFTCEKKRKYVEYQYWLWTNKSLETAQCYSYLVNSELPLLTLEPALESWALFSMLWWVRRTTEGLYGQLRWRWEVAWGTPSSSHQLHPHLPLNCFMFNIRACAGRSTQEKIALPEHSCSYRVYQHQCLEVCSIHIVTNPTH